MAKFRRQASVEWQTGPAGWRNWAVKPEVDADTSYFGGPWRQHNLPEEHQSAIAHHGEQRHALEIMPVRNREPRPGRTPDPLQPAGMWTWAIFKHDHTRTDNPWRFPSDWASGTDVTGSPAKYYGFTKDPEDAKREAEENWELHKRHVDSRNPIRGGDYDINDIMRGEGM
jgi:hypothetical protein